jgi:dihydroorotase/N-acyl-D-amino-acid deacylase
MSKLRLAVALAVAIAAMFAGVGGAGAQTYDLVMRNARVVDGTGSPWYRADIAIRGDTIARIAPSIAEPATRVIDLRDLAAAPGFIDLHTHSGRNIFQVPTADNYIRQGVTTIMEGPDGAGSAIAVISGAPPVPIKPFLDRLDALPKSINIGSFIGQGAVREAVIGLVNRPATPAELDRMRALVLQGMRDGAFGLSTGLFYVPGAFTQFAELVELQKVVSPFRGVHTSHMRDEAAGVIESVKETIAIGEQAGVPTHVSHHKMVGKPNWGKSVETLKLIDAARSRGIDVTMDQYPYTATSTTIQSALLPAWAQEGGLKETIGRLLEPATRAKIKAATSDILLNERGGGDLRNVVIARCEWDESLAGKNLAEVTQARGLEPTIANGVETTFWIVENGGCSGVFHVLEEEDVQRIMAHPATMIASDGGIPIFGSGAPHPRSYGTFARVLGFYVRERHILTLEDAVRKMSSFPAVRIGLTDRGVLRPGMKADIAVFDPSRVRDTATYEKPHQYAQGFAYVLVNGQIVYENGAMTAARPGRVLYGSGRSSAVQ